jgi:alkyl sulfatase BDS1-like metallo-beta-lactamase superfamily hydrolase
MADAGHVAWDMESYQWLLSGQDFPSIHPSLQRQAVLNMNWGLFEVVPGRIYQVRGFDLANISFIKGDTGWIVFDPLTAAETARAALALINDKLGKRPVVGVVYSHSHVDHWAGVRGVVDEADVVSGKVMLIAPEGFMEAAIAENVFAGNVMSRRSQVQYATLLERNPFGHVDQSIGKNVARGAVGLIAPNRLITQDIEEITLDGVKMVFQNAADTEAPVEMNTYFPQFKAFWAAEVVTGTIHNIYTLRGAAVRNALNWSKVINEALVEVRPGGRGDVRLAQLAALGQRPHPGGAAHAARRLREPQQPGAALRQPGRDHQRDPQRLRGTEEPAAAVGGAQLPRGGEEQCPRRDQPFPRPLGRQSRHAHPPLAERLRAAVRRDDGRQRQDHGQGPRAAGAGQIPRVGRDPEQAGVRRAPATSRRATCSRMPTSSSVTRWRARALRNTFLQGAYELRSGMPTGTAPSTGSADVIRSMPTGFWLDFLGISMDPKRAEGMNVTINLVLPDIGEKYLVELRNATLTNIEGFQSPKPDLTLTLNRADLNRVMLGVATFDSLAQEGRARFEGDRTAIYRIRDLMVTFTPDFEFIPGSAPEKRQVPPGRPFVLPDPTPALSAE